MDVKLSPSVIAPLWAGEWVSEVLGSVAPERRDAARTLVSELVASSVRNAHVARTDSIVVSLEMSDGWVRVEVADQAEAVEPSMHLEADPGAPELVLVERLADRWGMRSEGAPTVWFELDLT